MAIPRTSLRGFLSQARSSLQRSIKQREPVTFVIGNESADLDSITCAILYAYISSQTSRSKQTPLHIPLANIPRADLALRTELQPVCRAANIEQDYIITLDDLPSLSRIGSDLPPEQTRWILVDHNVLQGKLGEVYGHHVKGVIDHHQDENKVPKDTGDEPRIIETCGSCMSLVTERIRNDWDTISSLASTSGSTQSRGDGLVDDVKISSLWDAQVAQLALASILIDTTNLQDKNKTTTHDTKAVEYLEAKINSCPRVSKNFDRKAFFSEIQTAKQNLDSLNVNDILRKDYKQWTEQGLHLGMSTVVKSVEYLEDKAKHEHGGDNALADALGKFADDRKLDIAVIMTAFTNGNGDFAREMMVLARTEGGRACVDKFEKDADGALDIQETARGGKQMYWRTCKQGNLGASRKQVAPLLRKAMGSS